MIGITLEERGGRASLATLLPIIFGMLNLVVFFSGPLMFALGILEGYQIVRGLMDPYKNPSEFPVPHTTVRYENDIRGEI